ncbi:MAG: ABC transporter substrate-binding protein [Rhodomicrobium sp.]|nr:ABC transporter substrate-binding protein [Rhodomicrobium sp.]
MAQTSSQDRNAQRAEVNAAAVMIAASHPDTSMMKIADDMSVVLDDPQSGLRIVPVVGDGAIGNIRDVILLRNIDLGLTDLTALEHMRRSQNLSQFLAREIAHVVTLFPDKLSIMARTNISGIKALNGKKVSVGSKDGGAALHSEKIFKAFGINAQAVHLAPVDSAEALVKGEIDAFICFCLASPGVYQRVMFNTNLHMLPIPFEGGLQRDYLPATLTHEDFPSFISKGESVETVAVTLALVTYNWEKGNPRYNRVAKFVEQLFNNIQKFQSPARHKGWQSVQISATAPGWSRFAAAAEWQSSQRPTPFRTCALRSANSSADGRRNRPLHRHPSSQPSKSSCSRNFSNGARRRADVKFR